ncbi:hypothetical protein Lal_00027118 [Lupinus albus]|nr:hypothetical protein Lal_00027118 [Lupinus albus]
MCGADASEADGLTRCRMYEEKVNESQRSSTLTSVHHNHGYQGSKPTVGGFQPDVFPMCSKCGRKHAGTICPGSGNGCFHCKEKGHIKRFCPRLTQNVNVVEVGRPSTRGNADKAVTVGNPCEISDQASSREPMPALGVRTSLKGKDQCLFC